MRTRRFLMLGSLLLACGVFLSNSACVRESASTAGRFQTIDIRKAANSTYSDETANDDKGGWTDQGAANDLRMFKPGLVTKHGVPFRTIDPKTKNKEGK